jgi:TRAP-type mannitol/chloroaromatic compound transport system permease small subunit
MKPVRRYFIDSHPKMFINTQILWIVVGTGILDKWLPRVASSWKAGETYNLPQGIAYIVIGAVVVVANFILVNSGVNRLV